MKYRGLIETVIDVDAESEEEAKEGIKQRLLEDIAQDQLSLVIWLHDQE